MGVAREVGSAEEVPVRVVIVDDHVFMRDLMVRAITRQGPRYVVLASVGSAAEAIEACRDLKPDLLILDLHLPDKHGVDVLPEVKAVAPNTRVLLCTAFPTDDRIAHLADTGAHGFVEKTNTWDDFLHALERVSRGQYYFCCRSAQPAPETRSPKRSGGSTGAATLTGREKEILTLIAQGLTSKEIATELHLGVATIETHRANLMIKLGVRNVVGLAAYAFRVGLVKPGSTPPLRVYRGK